MLDDQEQSSSDNQEQQAPPVEEVVPVKDEYKGWIKMSLEEMQAAQEQGILMGYHPDKGLGLVNRPLKPLKESKKK